MTRLLTRAAALMGIAVALSGCVRFTSDNQFHSDNTVSQDTIIAFEPSAAEQLGIDLGDFSAATLEEQGAALPGIDPSKVTITEYTEGDLRGVRIVATDLTFEEFNASVSEVAQGFGPALRVQRIGDEYEVTMQDLMFAGDAEDRPQFFDESQLALLGSSVNVEVTVSFPGPVRSASAGEVNGKTVTLGLEDLLGSGDIEIRGQATDGIAWAPILQWGGIVLVALVIVGGAFALIAQDLRARKRTSLAPIPSASAAAEPAETSTRDETGTATS